MSYNNNADTARKQLAKAVVDYYVKSNLTIGLGTGRMANAIIHQISEFVSENNLKDLKFTYTSETTKKLAESLNLTVVELDSLENPIDITFDGADTINSDLDLIKGLGGAALRESIVASQSKTLTSTTPSSLAQTRLKP